MIHVLTRAVLTAMMMPLICAPAMADTPRAAPHKAQDPNEVVCEKQEVVGSRVQSRRVCMTRAQWADLRLQDRQEIEKVQVQRGMKGQ